MSYLVERSADVNGKNASGGTVLHFAATSGRLEVVKCLVGKGADVNGKDINGRTVLHVAVKTCKLDIVK